MRALLAAGLVLSACAPTGDESAPARDTASVPSVAVAARGAVLTSAVVRDGDGARLVVTHADGREATVARGAIADGSQAAPRLVASPNGTVLALYATETAVAGRRFPASRLWLARSADGGRTFAAAVPVHAEGAFPTGHTFADIAVGAGGAVFVSWLDGTADDAWKRANPEPPAAAHGAGDSLATAGVDPALAGTAAGWVLAVDDGGAVRRRASPQAR